MAELLEKNNVGWSSWTYKKLDDVGSSAYSIPHPAHYAVILKYVQCLTPASTNCIPPSESQSDSIMVQLANNAATEKCTFERDVVWALFGKVSSFALSVNPVSVTIRGGSSTSYALSIEPFGFNGVVNLSVSGLPAGATASFSPPSVRTSGRSALRISTAILTATGSYTLNIAGKTNGTSGSGVRTVAVALAIKR